MRQPPRQQPECSRNSGQTIRRELLEEARKPLLWGQREEALNIGGYGSSSSRIPFGEQRRESRSLYELREQSASGLRGMELDYGMNYINNNTVFQEGYTQEVHIRPRRLLTWRHQLQKELQGMQY